LELLFMISRHGRKAPRYHPLLRGIAIDPSPLRPGRHPATLPFLSSGDIDLRYRQPITILLGENGSGKTTLLESVAAACGVDPNGGGSYRATDDDRDSRPLQAGVMVEWSSPYPQPGIFVRADTLSETARALDRKMGALRLGHDDDEWRLLSEQSRGESVLSLLKAQVEGSEKMLYILDEPEAALSPMRQFVLLRLLDQIHKDGRSQVIMATHSPILMAHPEADLRWIDDGGINPIALEDVEHWKSLRMFMRNTDRFLADLFRDDEDDEPEGEEWVIP
jgi:predicted ATPase